MDDQNQKKPMEDPTVISHVLTKPKKCPQCGHMNPHLKTECRKCKAPLAENLPTLRCPSCGVEVKQDALKCGFCGLSMDEIKARSQFTLSIEKEHK